LACDPGFDYEVSAAAVHRETLERLIGQLAEDVNIEHRASSTRSKSSAMFARMKLSLATFASGCSRRPNCRRFGSAWRRELSPSPVKYPCWLTPGKRAKSSRDSVPLASR
jgi:hypothetical protein